MRSKGILLSILVLFLFSAASFAGEEGEQESGKRTLRTLTVKAVTTAVDGVATGATYAYRGTSYGVGKANDAVVFSGVNAYRGTRYGLKEGACDGTRAVYDGGKWFVHQTPAEHGRNIGRAGRWLGVNAGRQAVRTPGYAWSGIKFLGTHFW